MNRKEKRFLMSALMGAAVIASIGFAYASSENSPAYWAEQMGERVGQNKDMFAPFGCKQPDMVILRNLMIFGRVDRCIADG